MKFRPSLALLIVAMLGVPTLSEEVVQVNLDSAGASPAPAGVIALLKTEMVNGFQSRGIDSTFARFQSYLARKLDVTNRGRTGGEITALCRLDWYDHLLRNILDAPAEAERFTRELHADLSNDQNGLEGLMATVREKMDIGSPAEDAATGDRPSGTALEQVEAAVVEARSRYTAALAPLSQSEASDLNRNLYPVFAGQARSGHTLPRRSTARRLCRLLLKMDRQALHAAGEALVPLAGKEFLDELAALSDEGDVDVAGVTGRVAQRIETPGGTILIGSSEANEYQLDALTDVSVVIDLGGDDVYHEGAVSSSRPVLVIIDLGGNDHYKATKPGVQAGAVLGISMLLDLEGNDIYQARDVAQGSALGGVGILIDFAGDDQYIGLRRVQGHALGGLGVLLDRGGKDRYHAALWAQGLGNPLGFGVLDDLAGDDHYYCGGLYPDSYAENPGYDGWGQGVGSGLRQVANGGIGVILDGGGDDVYEYDFLAHGGGYWLGVGFARDFGGNDQHAAATKKAYNGGPRRQRSFQRFGTGYGCHYALGFLFDDGGDDVYRSVTMAQGFGQFGVGLLVADYLARREGRGYPWAQSRRSSVSGIRHTTRRPDSPVRTAAAPIAARMPKASASTPAITPPTAYPLSRQSR